MEDYIIRATAGKGSVRAFAAVTKQTVEKARSLHHTTPVATAALGRTLTAAAMMGSMLKGEKDILTIQIKGDGPLGGIVATSDSYSRVKGYVFDPQADVPLKWKGKLDVGAAVGRGFLNVIKDIGLKEPYGGSVELVSGEIAEDLTYYFAESEQTPSSVSLGVLIDTDYTVRQAGGMMIQLLPDAEEEIIEKIETRLREMESITTLLEEGKTPEEMLRMIFSDMELVLLDKLPVAFYCDCSREKVEKALLCIGKEELEAIYQEDGKANIHCHFCNKEYDFTGEDLKRLLDNFTQGENGTESDERRL